MVSDKKVEAMRKLFASVSNKKDWKMPINSLCRERDKKAVEEAINFFAGGGVEFKPSTTKGFVRVVAPGYYANGF